MLRHCVIEHRPADGKKFNIPIVSFFSILNNARLKRMFTYALHSL